MRLRSVLFILGALTVCLGLSLLPSMLVSLLYGEYDVLLRMARALLLVVSCGMAASPGLSPARRKYPARQPGRRGHRGSVLVDGVPGRGRAFVWVAHMSWTDAFFEAASGFTTTGATILIGYRNPAARPFVLAQSDHSGWEVWALSSFRWRCCPFWGLEGCRCIRPRSRGRSRTRWPRA